MTSTSTSASSSSSSTSSSTPSSRPPCVVQEDSLPWQTLLDRTESPGQPLRDAASHAAVYNYKRRQLGNAAGGVKLGCSLLEVAPGGCTAFPYHAHAIEEEAVYVLAGEGVMRMPRGDFRVGAGDYVAMRPGEEQAHQLWNVHATLPLRYLCISTNGDTDAVVSDRTPSLTPSAALFR